jgi:hypothetical protein
MHAQPTISSSTLHLQGKGVPFELNLKKYYKKGVLIQANYLGSLQSIDDALDI